MACLSVTITDLRKYEKALATREQQSISNNSYRFLVVESSVTDSALRQ